MGARSFDIRRVLTSTPLARQHERRSDGKNTRKPRPIPWESFDRRQFPRPAIDLAVDAYTKLAIGEYGAVQFYGQLTSEMALAGLPLDVVTGSASICTDEARHADYAMRMARALTGEDIPVRVEKGALEAPWKKDVTLEDIDDAVLHVAAISETIACALVTANLERATDATSIALYANLLADEIHHARFGWYYLSWRSTQWTRAERQRLADRMAVNVVGAERRYWVGRDAPDAAAPAARALGVIESEGQRAALRAVMETEIVPVLDSFGLGASHAWRNRERGPVSS
jgi:rubrerythrin